MCRLPRINSKVLQDPEVTGAWSVEAQAERATDLVSLNLSCEQVAPRINAPNVLLGRCGLGRYTLNFIQVELAGLNQIDIFKYGM